MTKRIAIVGTGISGLTCGYLLHQENELVVYETNDYIGGHTATKQVTVEGKEYAIDTGFIVYNDWTYPNFIKLMERLGIASQPTEMSFSVTSASANLEYNGNTLNTLFAQRRNILRPRFWRIVKDILAFNKACKALVASGADTSGKTLYSYIRELNLSDDFANYYILPMCAAIWSASLAQTRQFPLTFFLQFFMNHGLLNITDRPQWYTLKGGSSQYIAPLVAGFEQAIRLNTPVKQVFKQHDKWCVEDTTGGVEVFDEVIFACHSNQALAMLASPSDDHRNILGNIPYAENDVVMHTDTSLLPRRRLAWASWNYQLNDLDSAEEAPATVTYNMNILQCLESDTTFCVTLNNSDAIDPAKVLGRYRYAHPQYSDDMVSAQSQRNLICGQDNLHFCGAYWYNGFHEDGVRSALDVCQRFGASL
ncbi:FAD-dependent oxidoreductase [Alteromonas sp. ASW11-19]|uniref:FAD-dependent oxidoreductase n=1 Tax=Alteromonas salexigens TaxID=2982530 RepID=A0ABT2VRU8_9ALTE|nr:FAD-dependent oxidoreductase [Alteromonas salexigens]MCU7555774.1 FAD-dependent oxidoreductase [Alteromonas salexigens]